MRNIQYIFTLLLIILIEAAVLSVEAQDISIRKMETNKFAQSNMAPVVFDSTLIFTSNMRLSTFENYFNSDGSYVYKLYQVQLSNNKPIGNPTPFLKQQSGKFNIGSATISGDGKYMVVCQNSSDQLKNSNGKRGNTYSLYFSERNLSGEWSRLKPLPLKFKRLTNVVHPALSKNGNMLAFASDASDGLGKFDIYISQKVEGVWQEPKNMGKNINSEGNDLFPFFLNDKKLYFSTDGRKGFGGMDIYSSTLKSSWLEPEILEAPINSSANDFGVYIYDNEISGFVSSDRKSSDDIYFFEYTFPSFEAAEPQIIDTFCYQFSETSTEASENLVYMWNFGDGGTAKGLEAEHCFVGPGQYKVFLNVYDPISKEELYSVANYDLELDYTQQVFITCPDTVKVGQEFTLDAKSSNLGSLAPKDFFWIIANKDKRIGEQISYSFVKRGVYTILCGVVSRENPNERMASTRLIVVE